MDTTTKAHGESNERAIVRLTDEMDSAARLLAGSKTSQASTAWLDALANSHWRLTQRIGVAGVSLGDDAAKMHDSAFKAGVRWGGNVERFAHEGTFGWALDRMRRNVAVRRAEWLPHSRLHIASHDYEIILHNVQDEADSRWGKQLPYRPLQDDILATDWELYASAPHAEPAEPVELFGVEEQERLDNSIDECVLHHLDGLPFNEQEGDFDVQVLHFRPALPRYGERSTTDLLDSVLEALDMEYGDPDGNGTSPTPAMTKAAFEFVGIVAANYRPYQCDPTGEVTTVNAREWILANTKWQQDSPDVKAWLDRAKEDADASGD